MKIVVIGGSGLIGSKVVQKLTAKGHEVVAASPSTGVDTITGKGLAEALAGAEVVVDVSNSPSFDEATARAFFETSGRNLAQAEKAEGIGHHVAVSVVGTDRLQDSGYFRAKLAQEQLIKESGIPYTIIRATQYFEFLPKIAADGVDDGGLHLSNASFQPIAADDVAEAVAEAALAAPLNDTIEVAGPDRLPLSDFVARYLESTNDPRHVVGDPEAPYFGVRLDDASLVPGDHPHLGKVHLDDWLRQPRAH